MDFWPFLKLQKMESGRKKFHEIDYLISRVFLAWTFLNFLAHCGLFVILNPSISQYVLNTMKIKMLLFVSILILSPCHFSLSQPLSRLNNSRCDQLMENLTKIPKVEIINEAINVCNKNNGLEIINDLLEEAKEHCEEFQLPNKMAHCFKNLWKLKMNIYILYRMNYQNLNMDLGLKEESTKPILDGYYFRNV